MTLVAVALGSGAAAGLIAGAWAGWCLRKREGRRG